jgi:hypothetical protein
MTDLPFDETGELEPPDDVSTISSRVYRSVSMYAMTSLIAFSPTSTFATKFIWSP